MADYAKLIETEQHARLKRDRRSAVVILSAIAAMLIAVVTWLLLLSHVSAAERHREPVYWVLMLPLAFWAVQLAYYTPWTLRWLRVAQTAAPISTGLGVGWAAWTGAPGQTSIAVLLGICLAATFIGVFALRGSLLDHAIAAETKKHTALCSRIKIRQGRHTSGDLR
jgi:hypothetical protein